MTDKDKWPRAVMVTGRIVQTGPEMQQIRVAGRRRQRNTLVQADYSEMEKRVLAIIIGWAAGSYQAGWRI